MPLSKIDSLAEALDVFDERTALWESIGAWEELVRTWLTVPLSDLDKEQVLPSWCHAARIEHANRTDRDASVLIGGGC